MSELGEHVIKMINTFKILQMCLIIDLYKLGWENASKQTMNTNKCRNSTLGEWYTGTVSYTGWEDQCEFWIDINQTTYKDSDFPDGSMEKARNFCRNPNLD